MALSELNLRQLGWQPGCGRALFSALSPTFPIHLVDVSGSWSLFDASSKLKKIEPTNVDAKRFVAVAVPAEQVLEKATLLPVLDEAALVSALELQVQEHSPFTPSDTVWAWVGPGKGDPAQAYKIAIASRASVERVLEGTRQHLPAGSNPEVWFVDEQHRRFIFPGWGERTRLRRQSTFAALSWGFAALAVAALLGLAVVPTAQLRLRAIDAFHRYQALSQRTQPLVQQREQLKKLSDQEAALNTLFTERGHALRLMSLLTQTLPDDTFLQTLDLQGLKVKLTGVTANSSALTKSLGARPEVKNLRTPTPATRLGPNQEQFTLEFTLDADTMSLRPLAVSGLAPASDAATPDAKPQ